jgi:AAA family ATP:ADP antiporter
MAVSLLFWQFANQITRSSEAKRFYSRFVQFGNLAVIVSGLTVIFFSNIRESLPPDVDAWGVTLKWLMAAVTIASVAIMGIYRWMNQNVVSDPILCDQESSTDSK